MNEYDQQIQNAEHFLQKLKLARNDRDAFNRQLRVFLSESRSVLQYALKETKQNGHNKALITLLSTAKTIQFFKEARDISVHTKPITPNQIVSVTMNTPLVLADFWECTVINPDGTVASTGTSGSRNPPISIPHIPSTCSHTFHFDRWAGEEDVETLCETHLTEIRTIVETGLRAGWLTPERRGVTIEK